MRQPVTTIYQAAAVRDATGVNARPGFVAVRGHRIVASGPMALLKRKRFKEMSIIHLPTTLLVPAMVNAHAHLDLTTLGPQPYDGDFTSWLRRTVEQRPVTDGAIGQAVRLGVEMSRRAGVGWLGDIAGSPAAILARQQASRSATVVPGVSYLEVFGIGQRQEAAALQMQHVLDALPFETPVHGYERGVLVGIQPHAPFSAGMDLYMAADKISQRKIYRLSTHLAETPEEIEFIKHGTGPIAELLRSWGKWDPSIVATGMHPIDLLKPVLHRGRWLLAHCNYIEDHHLKVLARSRASVAYCPSAHQYFGHHQPEKGITHRYQDMLEAGVNVCLGTDSIVCHPPEGRQPLGILPEMRLLYQRDGVAPELLLKMATTNGMTALELDDKLASLRPGAPASFIGIQINPDDQTDPLEQALRGDAPAGEIPHTEG